MSEDAAYWDQRYAAGSTPWDSGVTPPEVEAFWKEHGHRFSPQDTVLDLGCGTLTNTAFLAQQGPRAIGVDLAHLALRRGSFRIVAEREQGRRLAALVGSVTQLPLPQDLFAYALDLGCLHTLASEDRGVYVQELRRVLAPFAMYQVFGFLRDSETVPEGDRRFFLPGELDCLFDPAFETLDEAVDEEAVDGRRGVWRLLHLR